MLAFLLGWGIVAGTLLTLVRATQELIRPDTRRDIAAWLTRADFPGSVQAWPSTFAHVFDRVFGERHLSPRCFARSCVASLLAVTFFTLLFFAIDLERMMYGPAYQDRGRVLALILLGGVVLNFIPDYLSLLETRWVLSRMARTTSLWRRCAWILFDLLATVGVFVACLLLASTFLTEPFFRAVGLEGFYFPGMWKTYGWEFYSTGIYAPVIDGESFIRANLRLADVFGIFFYSTFVTSIWIWLHLLGGLLAKACLAWNAAMRFARRHLAVEEKPVRFIGLLLLLVQTLVQGGAGLLALGGANRESARQDVGGLVCPESGIELVQIPSGWFVMGADDSDWDTREPAHEVRISESFLMARSEVTHRQWLAVFGMDARRSAGSLDEPVVNASWDEAKAFVDALNRRLAERGDPRFAGRSYRLPSEAEWEYACLAGSPGPFHCDVLELNDHAWTVHNSGGRAHPVGQKAANAWGLHDMHGNVWEWCADVWDPAAYQKRADGWTARVWLLADAAGESDAAGDADFRVVRGGGWGNPAATCQARHRFRFAPSDQHVDVGFRVVLVSTGSLEVGRPAGDERRRPNGSG